MTRKQPVELISLSEFARRKGVTLRAVQKAIENGRIEKADNGQIYWETQSVVWDERRNLSKVRGSKQVEAKSTDFHAAQLQKMIADANLKGLEYELKSKRLIDRERVRRIVFTFCASIRDSILSVPDRVSAELAGIIIERFRNYLVNDNPEMADAIQQSIGRFDWKDIEGDVHRVLEREHKSALTEVAKGPKELND